jgi:hypothetical protein
MFEAIVISGFVTGAILGSRFRVFVLVPAILFAIISTVAVSLASGVNLLTSFLAVFAVLASLQCGYVGGVVAAYFAACIKLPHRADNRRVDRVSLRRAQVSFRRTRMS